MAERYQIISHSENRLYQDDCPVICNAYNILKDNLTDTLLLQAKFENLSKKTIKEINFAINGYDISGNLLVENYECEYVAQNIGYRATFGDDIPITLDNNKIRKIDIKIINILFDNNDLWTSPNISKMLNLPEQKNIEEYLCSDELISEYNILTPKVSSKRKFPIFNESYWLCTCGEINLNDDNRCSKCLIEKNFLKEITNKDYIVESTEKRRIELEQQAKVKTEQRTKTTKKFLIFSILFIIISATFLFYLKIARPEIEYKAAINFLKEENYYESYLKFNKLSDYKDSYNYKNVCTINWLEKIIFTEDYDDALLFAENVVISDDITQSIYQKLMDNICKKSFYNPDNKIIDDIYISLFSVIPSDYMATEHYIYALNLYEADKDERLKAYVNTDFFTNNWGTYHKPIEWIEDWLYEEDYKYLILYGTWKANDGCEIAFDDRGNLIYYSGHWPFSIPENSTVSAEYYTDKFDRKRIQFVYYANNEKHEISGYNFINVEDISLHYHTSSYYRK